MTDQQYTPTDCIDVINFENRHCCMCQHFGPQCDRVNVAMTFLPYEVQDPSLFVKENGQTGCLHFAEREKRVVRRVTIISPISAIIEGVDHA